MDFGTANELGFGFLIGSFLIGFIVIFIAITIFMIVVKWKLFEKAGKPGWAAIVPIYGDIVLLDIIGYNWYYIFIFIAGGALGNVPYLSYIVGLALVFFSLTMGVKLAKAFGKDVGFGIALAFLSIVFLPMLAFSKDVKYVGQTVKGDIDFNDLF